MPNDSWYLPGQLQMTLVSLQSERGFAPSPIRIALPNAIMLPDPA